MSELTPNLKLFKYNTETDAKQPFSINDCMNANWDKIDAKCGSGNNLLDFKWSDHLLNDMSWLRADTFSWQDGITYSLTYNELLSEYNNSASITKTEGSITFKRTPKGYKIALATQETAILNKYNSDGIAWYYILDTTNKKFKLPRTKFGFEGLRGSVGDDIAESLPNITGGFTPHGGNLLSVTNLSGAFSVRPNGTTVVAISGNSGTGNTGANFNASRSSSTYQDNAPVQERATQMYLYFYVGEFTKSAEAQTAGLKAELLNNKLDLNASNLDTSGKNTIADLGALDVYRTIDIGTAVNLSVFEAPCAGSFSAFATSTATNAFIGFIGMDENDEQRVFFNCTKNTINNTMLWGSTPIVSSGSKIQFACLSVKDITIRFTPCVGAVI